MQVLKPELLDVSKVEREAHPVQPTDDVCGMCLLELAGSARSGCTDRTRRDALSVIRVHTAGTAVQADQVPGRNKLGAEVVDQGIQFGQICDEETFCSQAKTIKSILRKVNHRGTKSPEKCS